MALDCVPSSAAGLNRVRKRLGYGKSFASFGEIVQGRLSTGTDFLVTLPVDMWSRCELTCEPVDGAIQISMPYCKSQAVAEHLLSALGVQSGLQLTVDLERDMPIGKGLSSSTADMLAVVRAFEDMFGCKASDRFISELFTQIEPHDGLHYNTSVAYNHRAGQLLNKFSYTPDFNIIAIDSGGEFSTVEYNRNLDFTQATLVEYDRLYRDLTVAFLCQNDAAIAQCASRSVALHVDRTSNQFLEKLLNQAESMDVLGVLATHSGTCGGLLMPGNAEEETLALLEAAAKQIGKVFRVKTLNAG